MRWLNNFRIGRTFAGDALSLHERESQKETGKGEGSPCNTTMIGGTYTTTWAIQGGGNWGIGKKNRLKRGDPALKTCPIVCTTSLSRVKGRLNFLSAWGDPKGST